MNDITVHTGLRDWLIMMGYGNAITFQATITHGTTVSQSNYSNLMTADANSDKLAPWVPSDVGLLVTDMMADNCSAGLDYIDFQYSDQNHYRIYLPSSAQTVPVNILTRGVPVTTIVSGESSNTIYVSIHAISLDDDLYRWLLSKLRIDDPFNKKGTQAAQGEAKQAIY